MTKDGLWVGGTNDTTGLHVDNNGKTTISDGTHTTIDADSVTTGTLHAKGEIEEDLTVGGTTALKNTLVQTLHETGNITLDKDLAVGGKSYLKDTDVNGKLTADTAVIGQTVELSKDGIKLSDKNYWKPNGRMEVPQGDSKLSVNDRNVFIAHGANTVTVDGQGTTITGNTMLNNDLTVAGKTHLKAADTDKGVIAEGGLSAAGGDFTVDGTTGNVTPTGTLTGKTTLNDELEVTKGISAAGGTFTIAETTGNVATAGTLAVSGKTTLKDELEVAKKATLKDGLEVTKGFSAAGGNFTVAETTGNVEAKGTLGVTGKATLKDELEVTKGISAAGGNFMVDGTTGKLTAASGMIGDDDNKITVDTGSNVTRVTGEFKAGDHFTVASDGVVTASQGGTVGDAANKVTVDIGRDITEVTGNFKAGKAAQYIEINDNGTIVTGDFKAGNNGNFSVAGVTGDVETTGTLTAGRATVTSLDAGSGDIETTGAVKGATGTFTGKITAAEGAISRTSKDVVVGSQLNATNGNIQTVSGNMGDKANLTTTAKDTLVAGINEINSDLGRVNNLVGTRSLRE